MSTKPGEVQMKNEKYIILTINPNLGLFYQWEPLLDELQDAEFSIIYCLPRPKVFEEIKRNPKAVNALSKYGDRIMLKSKKGLWRFIRLDEVHCKDDNIACEKDYSGLEKKRWNYVWRMRLFGYFRSLVHIQGVHQIYFSLKNLLTIGKLAQGDRQYNYVSLTEIAEDTIGVLFDISQYNSPKGYIAELAYYFRDNEWFSIYHGIHLKNKLPAKKRVKIMYVEYKDSPRFCTIYLYSKKQVNNYHDAYGVSKQYLIVSGVPRHDEAWMTNNRKRSGNTRKNHILIIEGFQNKPAGACSNHVFRDTLLDIMQVAVATQKKILVRLRGKKSDEYDIFAEVFGEETIGDFWDISYGNMFTEATSSFICINFGSSMTWDFVRLGVPTVEYLKFLDDSYCRSMKLNIDRDTVHTNSVMGVASLATNKEELMYFISAGSEFLSQMIDYQSTKHLEHFEDPNGSVKKITDDIRNKGMIKRLPQ